MIRLISSSMLSSLPSTKTIVDDDANASTMTTAATYASLGFGIHIDSTAQPSFWQSRPTCVTLLKGRQDDDGNRRELLAAAGCRDGSLWIVSAGSIEGGDGGESAAPFVDTIITEPLTQTSRKSSSSSLLRSLNRESSPYLPAINVSPPVITSDTFEPTISIRKPSTVSSASSLRSASGTTFLPSSGLTARPQLSSGASGVASTPRRASGSSSNLRQALEDAVDPDLDHARAGLQQQLAGYARSGLDTKAGDEPKGLVDGLGIVAGLAGSVGGQTLDDLERRQEVQDEEDRQLESLERHMEQVKHREAAAPQENAGRMMVQIIPPAARGDPIVSLCVTDDDQLLIALTSRGQCLIIDALGKCLLDHANLEASSRLALGPHLDWRGLSTFVQDERRYIVAYAWPPSQVPVADPQTTLVVLVVDEVTRAIKECGRHVLPGAVMQVGVMKHALGPPTIIAADMHEVRVIPLLFGGVSGQQTPIKTNTRSLAGFFTPTPSRPSSSAADEEHQTGHGLTRILGKRFNKTRHSDSDERIKLGTSKVVKTFADNLLSGLYVSSKGLLVTWRAGALVEIYRSAGSTLHPYPQTITAAEDVTAVSTSSHDHFAFIQTQMRCEVYSITSRHQSTQRVLDLTANKDASFAMLGRTACKLGDEMCVGEVASGDVRWREVVQADAKEATSGPLVVSQGPFALVGSSEGSLCRRRFAEILAGKPASLEDWAEDDPGRPNAAIRCLRLFERKTDSVIMAGDVDGVVRCWNSRDLTLLETLPIFAQAVVQLRPFQGNVLAVCEDGTLAVIDIQDLHLLYLVPGSKYPLERVVLSDDDLTLSYANGKARVWNIASKEFRRSTAFEAAEEMLADRECVDLLSGVESCSQLLVDLDDVHLDRLAALGALHSFGIDSSVDEHMRELGVAPSKRPLRISLENKDVQQVIAVSRDVWRTSPRVTSLLQLLIVSLLRPMMDVETTEAVATQAITFYVALLPEAVDGFQDGDLSAFAWYYANVDTDIHQAARLLFDARLARLPDDTVRQLADTEMGQLPANQPQAMRSGSRASFCLTLFAAIALQKYQLLSAACLKDISQSILLSLSDAVAAPQQLLAIDFAAKGFSIWQSYVDPSELLRALFALVVSRRQASPAVIAQARVATLKLATTASALFVTTLSMDVIAAETVPQRESAMKLCVFVARKRPDALYPNLPRLIEAVVRSLDPTRVTARESIQRTATVILSELVAIFPTVDFATKTQKLAVGTREGATIVYDIKTATRLYVLEAHHKPLSALAFSPDGRRLVTVSVEERKLNVWKVGASIGSLFVVGGPPRQGGEPGKPFKAIDFALGSPSEEDKGGDVDPATGATRVDLTWPGDRTAKLQIGDMILTFAT